MCVRLCEIVCAVSLTPGEQKKKKQPDHGAPVTVTSTVAGPLHWRVRLLHESEYEGFHTSCSGAHIDKPPSSAVPLCAYLMIVGACALDISA